MTPKPESTKGTDAPKPVITTLLEGPKGTKCSITQQGGNMKVYRDVTKFNSSSNDTLKTMEISVNFLQLKELNANGTQVVDNENKTHAMTSFTDQTFTCANNSNTPVRYSDGIMADCFYCWTSFKGIFEKVGFKINVCILKNNGTITQSNELSNVTAGQLKFTLEMTKGWPWCDNTCKSGVGQYMDLDIGIKLPGGIDKVLNKTVKMQDKPGPARIDLGSGAGIEFSKIAGIDGTWKPLAQNTPSMVQKDGMTVVTLRFLRFDNDLLYDPTIETGDKAYFEGLASSSTITTALTAPLFLSALMAIYSGVF